MLIYEKYIDISSEIMQALYNEKPVVALGSTIISHEIPYPLNVEMALKAEKIIRDTGAIPATIAILNGRLKVGLTKDEIEYLGKFGNEIIKTSRRDIPLLIAKKSNGATTVASTMIIANIAGIKVIATGGIGGVHRSIEQNLDISADLEELERTDVAIVCSGTKSFLDIHLTLEYLETKGVPVVGYKTDYLPAFYRRESEFNVDYRVDDIEELAQALKAKWELHLNGGIVIGNPIPKEFEMDEKTINNAINIAVDEAKILKISGKKVTPFLLQKIRKLTDGRSLTSNVELLYNNAKLASELAIKYSKI